MRKLKTVVLSMVLIIAMVFCSSCTKTDLQVRIESDGSSTVNIITLISKSDLETIKAAIYPQIQAVYGTEADTYMEQTFGQIESCELVTVDGKEYYKYVDDRVFNDVEELQKDLESMGYFGSVSIGADHFYAAIVMNDTTMGDVSISEQEIEEALTELGLTKEMVIGMASDIKIAFTVEFPNNITYSNGEYEANSNKVTWDLTAVDTENADSEMMVLYAETMEPSVLLNDKTAPSVTGIKNNGFYNKGTIKISDNVGIAGIKADGESYSVLSGLTGNGEVTTAAKNTYALDELALTQGKHTIKVFDFAGNTTTIKCTYDTKKPTVKGVSNGKTYKKARTITFSDTYGIKSAKLNGKTIKTKKKVSKKGSYTLKVTDKAGNVKTVKFKIKK